MEKIHQLKEIGQKFKNQMNKYKSNARKIIAGTLVATALTSCTGSLTQGAKADYIDGTTQELLDKNKNTYNASVESYHFYLKEYEKQQKEASECLSNGDLQGARLAKRRATELKETIKNLAEEIDELKDQRITLTEYEQKGKKKAAGEREKGDFMKRHFEKME